MGFFDGLAAAAESVEPGSAGPVGPVGPVGIDPQVPSEQDSPPSDRYLPAVVAYIQEVGAGPEVRVHLVRLSVWPDALTLHLAVFLRPGRSAPSTPTLDPRIRGALRVGLLLSDGRRVTTLDTDPPPVEQASVGADAQPLRLRQADVVGDGLRHDVDLVLSGLPPEGRTELVVEWPAEKVPETHSPLSAALVRAAARKAVDVWASAPRSTAASGRPETIALLTHTLEQGSSQRESLLRALADRKQRSSGAASGVMPVPGPQQMPARKPQGYDSSRRGIPAGHGDARAGVDPARYTPRPDWEGIGVSGWHDLALITARLDAGADPNPPAQSSALSPLQCAAGWGSAEVVAELIRRGADPAATDSVGHTPLWTAVRNSRAAAAAVLLAAGVDPWEPVVADRSPGQLALVTPLAPMFERLAGATPLTPEERAAQEEADRAMDVFSGVHTDALGIALVAGLNEDDVIRRLGGDPERCPVVDPDSEPGLYGYSPDGVDLDPDNPVAQEYVGVTAVPGGCALVQTFWYLPSDRRVLQRISLGTVAAGAFFHPSSAVFATLVRDGQVDWREEVSHLHRRRPVPPGYWRFRIWQSGEGTPYQARELAFLADLVGVSLQDRAVVTRPPRRWLRVDRASWS